MFSSHFLQPNIEPTILSIRNCWVTIGLSGIIADDWAGGPNVWLPNSSTIFVRFSPFKSWRFWGPDQTSLRFSWSMKSRWLAFRVVKVYSSVSLFRKNSKIRCLWLTVFITQLSFAASLIHVLCNIPFY
jgi:hypothetical protein